MSKRRVIFMALAALILLGGVSAYAIVERRRNQEAQVAAASAEREHAAKIAAWQASVMQWNEQQKAQTVAATTAQSDLQQQGVAVLPNTGTSNPVTLFMLTTVVAGSAHYFVSGRRSAVREN